MQRRMRWLYLSVSIMLSVMLLLTGCGSSGKQDPANTKDTGMNVESGVENGAGNANGSGDGSESSKEDVESASNWSSMNGYWEGAIEIPNQPLLIQVTATDESGVIAIPIQGINDYPLSNARIKDDSVYFEMALPGQVITFDGKQEQHTISGTFQQNGQSFPFKITKQEKEISIKEEKLVQVKVQQGTMVGELEIPQGEGPYPLAIIIAGSGPTDRDGNSTMLPGKNNSLKMVAEQLAEQGVASIRYDKRGIGMNSGLGGKEEDVTFELFAEDTAQWIEFVRADDRFSAVGVVGHSEGSLVGLVAMQKAKADFFISLAGAGRTIDHVLLEQLTSQLPDQLLQEAEKIVSSLKQGQLVSQISPELASLFRPSIQPYMISWMNQDPAQLLQKLKIPTLIVNGTNDLQVAVSEAKVLHQADQAATLLIVDGMNHNLKETTLDREENIAALTNPDLPLANELMKGIISFLQKHQFIAVK
ncbi:alpha/beta hydrolase family protein [Paenibacillus yanchengensis]|uniref:Alpha/beta hydrolase family protein n=1 Tax=Paenibacillus yanchengensis TaxID=2035833 RepID=A0ABW4YK40_9BACL